MSLPVGMSADVLSYVFPIVFGFLFWYLITSLSKVNKVLDNQQKASEEFLERITKLETEHNIYTKGGLCNAFNQVKQE